MSVHQFTIFGNKYRMGSYVLLIRVSSPLQLAFGMFRHGALLAIPEGDYLYIGSALGNENRGSPLGRRLLRHASRSGNRIPHNIRAAMVNAFAENDLLGNDGKEPSEKKLRWHIDYLLDRPEAEINHIVIIRNPEKLENKLAELLESLDETSPLATRLGAGDTRHSTHLLRFTDRDLILDLLRQTFGDISDI